MISGGKLYSLYYFVLFWWCRYPGILEKFRQFCSNPSNPSTHPVIKKGEAPQLVLVGFRNKEDAVRALSCLEEVNVASSSRI